MWTPEQARHDDRGGRLGPPPVTAAQPNHSAIPPALALEGAGAPPEQLAIRSTLVELCLHDHRLRAIGLRRSGIDLISWRVSPGQTRTSRGSAAQPAILARNRGKQGLSGEWTVISVRYIFQESGRAPKCSASHPQA